MATFQKGKFSSFLIWYFYCDCYCFVVISDVLNVIYILVFIIYFCFHCYLFVYQVEQDFGIVGRDGQGPPETLDRLLGVAFHPPEVADLKENEKFI